MDAFPPLSLLTVRPQDATPSAPATSSQTGEPGQPAGGDPGSNGGGGGFGGFNMLPLVLIFAIFYFVMIAPERKNRKKREAMLSTLKKGDKVMTNGGMFATVASVQDDVVTLQVADGVRVRFSRQSVQTILNEEPAEQPAAAAKK